MKTAQFTNFTNEEFTGYWDGKPKKFKPGESVYMPDYLAAHFAKHLTNKELLRMDNHGNLIHKDGDKMTSPKNPERVPLFMEFYNKAFTPDEKEILGDKKDDVDTLIDVANEERSKEPETEEKPKSEQSKTEPQVVLPPDMEEEAEFDGKPVEEKK